MKRKTTQNLKSIHKGILNVRKAALTEIKQATKVLDARKKKLAGFEKRINSMVKKSRSGR